MTNVGTIANQDIAVAAFQSRACDNAARAQTTVAVDPSGDRVQPGPTILVGERNTVVHLLDVCSRVKPIGVLELPSQARSEKCADGGFPRARNSHHNDRRGIGQGSASFVVPAGIDINSSVWARRPLDQCERLIGRLRLRLYGPQPARLAPAVSPSLWRW